MTDTQSPIKKIKLQFSTVLAVFVAIAAMLWIASGYWPGDANPSPMVNEKNTSDNTPTLPLVTIVSSTAKAKAKSIILFGLTEPVQDINVRAETIGRIRIRPAVKGQSIKSGSTILSLFMDDRLAKKQQAEALYEYQKIAFAAATKLSKKQFQSRVKLAKEKADLAKAVAELNSIQLDIRRTTITSPINGIIENLPYDVGDRVKAGDIIARIISLNPIKVTGAVSERQFSQLTTGSPAEVTFPDGTKAFGNVIYLSKASSGSTRTFRVEVEIDNSDQRIVAGLTSELRLSGRPTMGHKVSPSILTLNKNGQIGIKIVDENGYVQFKPIKILSDTPTGIWLGGLDNQIDIITNGQEFVKSGQRVRTTQDPQLSLHQSNSDKPSS